ncbi:MAG: CHAT domain-containing protein [Deltaproteobacteria bacterium]|nr:CHAT domain-containing protein [Deltaproteobacteria bacterium]
MTSIRCRTTPTGSSVRASRRLPPRSKASHDGCFSCGALRRSVGEGVYGLRRAFFIAGAETVVTSLWKVSDDSTTELMTAFDRELRRGRGRTQALALAARALPRQHPHPYHWAPLIVLGRSAPLRGFGTARTR